MDFEFLCRSQQKDRRIKALTATEKRIMLISAPASGGQADDSSSSSSRLLDAEPCTLDVISSSSSSAETTVLTSRDGSFTYWLSYKLSYNNKEDHALSVLRGFNPPPQTRTSAADHLLCLQLRVQSTSSSTTTTSNSSDEYNSNDVGTKLLHSDEFVNIWEFRLAPQERCDFHVHKFHYCFTNLTESTTQALDEQGKFVGDPSLQVQGQTSYVTKDLLGEHAVVNVGSTIFLQFIVEFKY